MMDEIPHITHTVQESNLARKLRAAQGSGQYECHLLGAQIKRLRQERGMTQKELATKLNTTQSVVARIESGQQNMTISTLAGIGHIFSKKLTMLFE